MKTISTLNLEVARKVLKKLISNDKLILEDGMHNKGRVITINPAIHGPLRDAGLYIEQLLTLAAEDERGGIL